MIKYVDFINEEAVVAQMRIGDWALFGSNMRISVTPTKGLYAKIINKKWGVKSREFVLEFEKPITIKSQNVEGVVENIETNSVTLSSHQISKLTIIPADFIEEFKAGHNMPYMASLDFRDIISDIKFYPTNTKFLDVSYFDINKENDETVTFLPSNKYQTSVDLKEAPFQSKFRQSTKIGRIFRKLNKKLTDVQVEKLVSDYRATWKLMFNSSDLEKNFQVVTGDSITYWYNMDKYASGGGTLNNSCMRGIDKQKRVAFYSKYPDKVAMAILLDNDNKLLARALIWKLDSPEGVIFMDRIYYVKTYHSKILENYAAKNNIKTKSDGWNLKNHISVKIPYKNGDPLPFLDSFRWDDAKKEFVNK